MKTIELKAVPRKSTGKSNSKRLRIEEKVPCVIYGGVENSHIEIVEKDLRHLVYTPDTYLVDIDVEGKKEKVIMQDIQFHPVTDRILHIDFLRIFDDKKIVVELPVVLKGLAPGVKEGGKLKLELRKLKVRGFSKDMPENLTVDISSLVLGSTVKVKELEFENLEILNPKTNVVVSVKLTRVARGMSLDEDEEGEGEEGAEGEGEAEGKSEE
ncbi:MAG: 50S ribosomal protein L25 [Marinilabiliales bacterium]|nr:MAG: 50S ribosomal protein L25 [Marinilabiliales bacterium]